MELESIPGVGEKTAAALDQLDDPERAIRRGDVATIATAPGVSTAKAARIARAAIRERHEESTDFLETAYGTRLYRELLGLLQDRTVTSYAKHRLETFYPSTASSRIHETRSFVSDAIGFDPSPAVIEALEGVETLRQSNDISVDDRCLVTSDPTRYHEARKAYPELPVELVEDARGIGELARAYSMVIVMDEEFAGSDFRENVRVHPDVFDEQLAIVPERTLSFFAVNKNTILGAIAVHEAANLDVPESIDALAEGLSRLGDNGSVTDDPELDRLEHAIDKLTVEVETAERDANTRLRAAIRESELTIEGGDLLSMAEQGARVASLLSHELADEFVDASTAAQTLLVESLELTDEEQELVQEVFPSDPMFPLERNESAVTDLRDELRTKRAQRMTLVKQEIAERLAPTREIAESLVHEALEFDVKLAITRFTRDFECTMPTIDGTGVQIEGGRCPLLDCSFETVEPVEYAVDGIVLLSGVNSGGKTSTLDLLATITILTHMGLPVPAKSARVQRFDGLYYFTKSPKTLNAGGLESTLREFQAITSGDGERLILVDELESITEPGASAKIIGGILELLGEETVTAVFVSHLAAEIQDAADCELQVDGIEAVGLENGELVVNRSPVKNRLARSTPELILEKLADDDSGEFYEQLLKKFSNT